MTTCHNKDVMARWQPRKISQAFLKTVPGVPEPPWELQSCSPLLIVLEPCCAPPPTDIPYQWSVLGRYSREKDIHCPLYLALSRDNKMCPRRNRSKKQFPIMHLIHFTSQHNESAPVTT